MLSSQKIWRIAIQDWKLWKNMECQYIYTNIAKMESIADQKVDKNTSVPRSFKKFDKRTAFDIVPPSILKSRGSYYRIQLTRTPSLPL